MIAAGVDAFRLNFSHGTPEDHAVDAGCSAAAAAATGREIAIVQDLGGPKIRIGTLSEPLVLVDGGTRWSSSVAGPLVALGVYRAIRRAFHVGRGGRSICSSTMAASSSKCARPGRTKSL